MNSFSSPASHFFTSNDPHIHNERVFLYYVSFSRTKISWKQTITSRRYQLSFISPDEDCRGPWDDKWGHWPYVVPERELWTAGRRSMGQNCCRKYLKGIIYFKNGILTKRWSKDIVKCITRRFSRTVLQRFTRVSYHSYCMHQFIDDDDYVYRLQWSISFICKTISRAVAVSMLECFTQWRVFDNEQFRKIKYMRPED